MGQGSKAAHSKREKKQSYAKKQNRRQQQELQRQLEKLAKAQLRELTRALKKAKSFELAKVARKIKEAIQEEKSAQGLVARQATLKQIAIPILVSAVIEKHGMQVIAPGGEHSKRKLPGGEGCQTNSSAKPADAVASGAQYGQEVQKILASGSVRKAVEEAQAALHEHKLDAQDAHAPAQPQKPSRLQVGGRAGGSEIGSRFLESLGGHDSDPDDDQGGPPQRKNRRGQRARQKLAEKQFGQKAKHVQLLQKKEAEKVRAQQEQQEQQQQSQGENRKERRKRERDQGLPGVETEPATHMPEHLPKRAKKIQKASAVHVSPATDATQVTGSGGFMDEKMHPSWIAKQQLKQRQALLAAAGPKRSRVVFD